MEITHFIPTGIELGRLIDTLSRNKSINKTTEILLFLHSFSSLTSVTNSAEVHQLLSFLSHPHPHVRKATCDLFVKLPSAETAQVLAGALATLVNDPMPAVRASAWPAVVAACAQCPDHIPISLFEKACGALQDEFDIVRKEALVMIALWGRHMGGASESPPAADRAFLHISTTATDMSRFVRQEGFRQLASLPVPGVTFPTLHLSLFKKVARAASALAGKVGGAGGAGGEEDDAEGEDVDQALLQSFAAGALVHGLEDEFWQVRSEALRTLASFCQRCSILVPPAVVHFVDALNDDNLRVRILATDSLLALSEGGKLEMAEEQTRIVMRTLESASWRVRKGALQLLGTLRYATRAALSLTAGALVEHLDKRSTDEACTLGALAHMGGSHGGLVDDMWTQMQTKLRASLASERGLSGGTAMGLLVLIGAAACARPSLADKIPSEMWGHLRLLKRKVPGNYLVGVGKKRRVDVGEGIGFGGGVGRNEPSNVAETIEMCLQTAFGVLPLVERGEGKEAAEVLRHCNGQLERMQRVHLASETAIRFALLEIEALEGMVAIRVSTSALLDRGKREAELREIQLAGGKIERIVLEISARYKNLGAERELKVLELRLVAATCRFLGSEIEGYDAMSYDLSTRKELSRRRETCLELMGRIRTFCDSHCLSLPALVTHLELPPISERKNNTTLSTISMSALAPYWLEKTSCDRSMTRLWGTVSSPSITSGKAEFVRGMPLSLSIEVVVYNISVGDQLLLKFEFGSEGLGAEYRFLDQGDLGGDDEIEQEPSYEELPLSAIKRCRINKTLVLYKVPLEPFPLRCSLGIESNIEEFTKSMIPKGIVNDWFGETGPKNVVVRVSDFWHIHLAPTMGQAG